MAQNGFEQKLSRKIAITIQTRCFLGGQGPKGGFRLLLITLVLISLLPSEAALSEPPIPGIYIGDFIYWTYGAPYSEIAGPLGIFVSNKRSAIIATFPSPSIDAFSKESCTVIQDVSIEADGTFEVEAPDRTCHVGQFTTNRVSGDYPMWDPTPPPVGSCTGPDWGDFSGTRVSNIGGLSGGGGFYEGTISGEVI
jgi:hypothetical protein